MRALAGDEAAKVIEQWPSQSREAAVKTVQRHGAPEPVTPSRLIWKARGHWRRVIVNRDVVPHHFPKPHNDLLEEWIVYRIPAERLDDVAASLRSDSTTSPRSTEAWSPSAPGASSERAATRTR